ncbi:MAG TPA: plastocyanin/azurin family copper-binding protein, partial [Candidatus Limnocylindrales bacterium]|nr:plastocyanin/azurin family copper-binding protein [Candidatus Limnocylindrales bacterium]
LGLASIATAWAGAPGFAGRGGDTVEIGIHFSTFARTEVVARAGVPLRVTLVNTDPIDHEWLVGDAAFHERHRTGTETHHDARPTELSIPAGTTRTTTVTFREPGDYLFICHLPGHEAYGMVGVLHVLP